MPTIVHQVDLGDNSYILFESLPPPQSRGQGDVYEDVSNSSRIEDVLQADSFISGVGAFARKLRDSIAAATPDEGKVEFQVAATAKEGNLVALVCGGSISGSVKVTLTWRCN